MRYAAKVDWWIGFAVLSGLAMPIVSAAQTGSLWIWGVVALTWALVFGFCWPQWYELTADELVIKTGLRVVRIPLAQITSLAPTSDSRSAMPMTLDRMRLEYTGGELLIAPKDQTGFVRDLATLAPQMRQSGERLALSIR